MKYAFHEDVRVIVCDGVYEPGEDTYLILDNINIRNQGNALDVGTGSGIIAIWLAKRGYNVVATDISDIALKCAKFNAKMNNVQLSLVKCDLASAIKGKFDIVTFNPPYLPFKDDIPEEVWWFGGKSVIERFLKRDLPRILSPKGSAYLVYSSLTDMNDVNEILPKRFKAIEIAKKRMMFEELYLVEVLWK